MSFFTPEATTLAPWSVSKAKTSIQCPWKFKHQYLLKTVVPEGKIFELDDSNLRVGSSVHKYAEEIARGRESSLAAEIAIDDGRLLNDEEDSFRSMMDNVEGFETRISNFKEKRGVTEDLIEKRLGLSESLTPAGFFSKQVFFRGVMDRTLIVGDQHAVIIDIKTGSYPSLKYARDQINAYSLLALCTWPKIGMVHPALYFASTGDLLWSDKIWRKDYEDISSHPTVTYINEAAKKAKTDEICPGKYCSWCPYKVMCLEERKVRREAERATRK